MVNLIYIYLHSIYGMIWFHILCSWFPSNSSNTLPLVPNQCMYTLPSSLLIFTGHSPILILSRLSSSRSIAIAAVSYELFLSPLASPLSSSLPESGMVKLIRDSKLQKLVMSPNVKAVLSNTRWSSLTNFVSNTKRERGKECNALTLILSLLFQN